MNQELLSFFQEHYKRGRIALVGTDDFIGHAIRDSLKPITPDGNASLWSHAFILGERRPDRRGPEGSSGRGLYIFESDLHIDLFKAQSRNGAQENWIGKWCKSSVEHAAVFDFGLSESAVDSVLGTALQLCDEQLQYPIGELIGTWWAIVTGRVWRKNPLDDPHAMYCSAFARHCYREAGRDFIGSDVAMSNTSPEHIARAAQPVKIWHRPAAPKTSLIFPEAATSAAAPTIPRLTNIVASYRSLHRAIGTNEAASGLESAVAKTTADPVQAAAALASIGAALRAIEKEEKHPDVLSSPNHRMAALLQAYVSERAATEGKLVDMTNQMKEVKFDTGDWLGWAGDFINWIRGLDGHDWMPAPLKPDFLPNEARVAILGDWGSGLYGAPTCAKSIQADSAVKAILHLGDVYYSGTEKAVRDRFLAFWPRVKGAVSRACNSNHEMYTGGYGYFNLTLPEFKQSSSCFALQNDHWTLVGLDSAYADYDFHGEQIEWLTRLVEAGGARKTILFCHHQPFSHFESQGPKLLAKLGPLLKAGKIFAWYFGHEHRCVLFDRHPTWGLYSRCVGHSGMPYEGDKLTESVAGLKGSTWWRLPPKNLVPGGRVLYGPNPHVEGHEDEYGPNGYATLDFKGPSVVENIHAANGDILLTTPLP